MEVALEVALLPNLNRHAVELASVTLTCPHPALAPGALSTLHAATRGFSPTLKVPKRYD